MIEARLSWRLSVCTDNKGLRGHGERICQHNRLGLLSSFGKRSLERIIIVLINDAK